MFYIFVVVVVTNYTLLNLLKIHLKWVDFILCKLYLNKANFKMAMLNFRFQRNMHEAVLRKYLEVWISSAVIQQLHTERLLCLTTAVCTVNSKPGKTWPLPTAELAVWIRETNYHQMDNYTAVVMCVTRVSRALWKPRGESHVLTKIIYKKV